MGMESFSDESSKSVPSVGLQYILATPVLSYPHSHILLWITGIRFTIWHQAKHSLKSYPCYATRI